MIKTNRPEFQVPWLISLLFTLYLSVVPGDPCWAQQRKEDPWWITLEEGKRSFRNGSYGDALRSFENARESKKNYFAKMEKNFIAALSSHEARKLKDDLDLLEIYIQREFQISAQDALNELYYRVPRDTFRNSAKAALAALGNLKNYPEAEYWIGEVYRMEGEYNIAIKQYGKALDKKNLLEYKELELEILYKTAGLQQTRRDYVEMVKAYEDLLKNDTLWSKESFTRSNLQKSLETNGMNRFLLLFRHNEPSMERAHRTMGFYYYTNGRHDRAADHLLFAFLIQNSVIIDAVLRAEYDYKFTTIPDLLRDIAKRRDLLAYINETEYYRTLFYLANSLYGINRNAPARELWTFLSNNAPGEWQARAASQLRSPKLDPIPPLT
jgi:tetratricopeptide (TPR) repeat protein